MERKLRFINKKMLAAFTLVCGLAYQGNAINHKKAKDDKSQLSQNKTELTVEQVFFDEVNEVNKKKTSLNVNLGPAVTINPDSTTEYGSFSDVNIVIPIEKKKGNLAVIADIEDSMVQDNSYSCFGVDNTTHQLMLGAGLQKNFKNGGYLNCGFVGGVQHRTINTIINIDGGTALRHEKIWDTPVGAKVTVGQIRKKSISEITFGGLYNPQGKEFYPEVYLAGGRQVKNGSKINIGMKFSTTIKLGNQGRTLEK